MKAKSLRPALILLDIVRKGSDTDRFWAQKQGSSDYVVKPFAPEQLATAIRRFV